MATQTDETPLVYRNEDGTLPEEALAANQLFTPEQLPDPKIWEASGLAGRGQVVPEHLVLEDEDDAYSHPLGPEPGHALRAAQTRAVEDRLGWHREAVESRARQGAAPAPDETTRIVQGASIAQAKILAGKSPEQAVKETEKELAKADKQVEQHGPSGAKSDTSPAPDEAPNASAPKAEWLTYARNKGYKGEDDDITLEELKAKYGN